MTSSKHIDSVVVLAGGASRRFGSDKAQLVYQGKTLLEHACELGLQVADTVIVSVAETFQHQVSHSSNVRVIVDAEQYNGPIAALRDIAVSLVGSVCVIPVDMPLLEPTILLALADSKATAHPTYAVCGHKHFALCVYPAETLASAPIEIDSFRQLHAWASAQEVVFPQNMCSKFANINTPSEFQQLP